MSGKRSIEVRTREMDTRPVQFRPNDIPYNPPEKLFPRELSGDQIDAVTCDLINYITDKACDRDASEVPIYVYNLLSRKDWRNVDFEDACEILGNVVAIEIEQERKISDRVIDQAIAKSYVFIASILVTDLADGKGLLDRGSWDKALDNVDIYVNQVDPKTRRNSRRDSRRDDRDYGRDSRDRDDRRDDRRRSSREVDREVAARPVNNRYATAARESSREQRPQQAKEMRAERVVDRTDHTPKPPLIWQPSKTQRYWYAYSNATHSQEFYEGENPDEVLQKVKPVDDKMERQQHRIIFGNQVLSDTLYRNSNPSAKFIDYIEAYKQTLPKEIYESDIPEVAKYIHMVNTNTIFVNSITAAISRGRSDWLSSQERSKSSIYHTNALIGTIAQANESAIGFIAEVRAATTFKQAIEIFKRIYSMFKDDEVVITIANILDRRLRAQIERFCMRRMSVKLVFDSFTDDGDSLIPYVFNKYGVIYSEKLEINQKAIINTATQTHPQEDLEIFCAINVIDTSVYTRSGGKMVAFSDDVRMTFIALSSTDLSLNVRYEPYPGLLTQEYTPVLKSLYDTIDQLDKGLPLDRNMVITNDNHVFEFTTGLTSQQELVSYNGEIFE